MTDGTVARTVGAWLEEAAGIMGSVDPDAIARACHALEEVRARSRVIFLAGNGGSAATASHFALDLQKAARRGGSRVRAVSLSDNVGLLTAWANDVAFERVFAEQLDVLAQSGDALVVISVSGASPNLLAALKCARERGLVTIGLLGRNGGPARDLVDHAIVVPSDDYGWVESAHLMIEHVITYTLAGKRAGRGGEAVGAPALQSRGTAAS